MFQPICFLISNDWCAAKSNINMTTQQIKLTTEVNISMWLGMTSDIKKIKGCLGLMMSPWYKPGQNVVSNAKGNQPLQNSQHIHVPF